MTANNPTKPTIVFQFMPQSPCESLVGRLRDICIGDAKGVSRKLRRAYIDRWLADGRLPADPDATGIISKLTQFVEKAFRFSRALVAHAADGLQVATDADQEKRRAICRACPVFNAKNSECRVCGCNLKIKTRWRSSRCPDSRW